MVAAMADPADIQRLVGDLLREGLVVSVNHANASCTVQLADDLTTGDIPWLAARVGSTRSWSPPSVGEQVLVLCPEGDTERAIVAGSLGSDANPHLGADASTRLDFEDGASIVYDPAAHVLTATLPAGGTAELHAPAGIKLVGPVRIEGDVDLQGTLTASADVVGAGKSLKGHKHTGVSTGSGISGAPQ